MDDRRIRPGTFGIPTEENPWLSELEELIEISIGHANLALHSIQDITRLLRVASSHPRNRDSGFFEPQGLFDGGDTSRKLLELEQKVQETRTCLRDLQRANLRGLQLILEGPEELVMIKLKFNMKTNFSASKEISQLAQTSPQLMHISQADLEDSLPASVNIRSLMYRLSQVSTNWDLPFTTRNARFSLCNSAKLLNSGKNNGVVEHAQLRVADKKIIKEQGGSFQFWKCDLCHFRVRYHIIHSNTGNIETTEEVRRPGKGHLTLRTVFLAKSHLYMESRHALRYACLFCVGNGERLVEENTAFLNENELADHIDGCHDFESLPKLFMDELYVALPDENPNGRYDVQFHRTRSAL